MPRTAAPRPGRRYLSNSSTRTSHSSFEAWATGDWLTGVSTGSGFFYFGDQAARFAAIFGGMGIVVRTLAAGALVELDEAA